MEQDDTQRLDTLAFDEASESWFVMIGQAQRIALDRATLEGLVRLYNGIHTGAPLRLYDLKSFGRIEERNARLGETIRDLHLRIDRLEQSRLRRRIPCLFARWLQILVISRPRRR